MTEYKGYNIVSDGTYGFKEIKAIGKGSVHKELRGKFTHGSGAMKHIDQFLESQPAKVTKKEKVKDGKDD